MVYDNPDYNPEWERVHARHAPKRDQAMTEMQHLAATGQMGTPIYDEAKADYDWHHRACLDAHQNQFATVQDYARWLLTWGGNNYLYDPGIPVSHLDVDELCTMPEATAAWSRVTEEAEGARNKKLHSLPICQPEGLEAFANASLPSLTHTWRTFSPDELYPEGYGKGGTALVSVEERDDGFHVCFGQDLDFPGQLPSQYFLLFAAAFYREVNALHAPLASKGFVAWFRRWRGKGAPASYPAERFHFYLHVPPQNGLKECFDRVMLRFEGGKFHEDLWVTFKSIPAVIQSAREYLRRLDNVGPGSQQRRMLDGL